MSGTSWTKLTCVPKLNPDMVTLTESLVESSWYFSSCQILLVLEKKYGRIICNISLKVPTTF